jgi:thiol-disulfide isomerase/thioredoxin
MKKVWFALVYTALMVGANPTHADMASIEALRTGDMKKLVFASDANPVPATAFELADGAGQATLAAYQGRYVLLNFWATWCAPCRTEMPMLSDLQTDFGGDDFEVLTIATGRNSPVGIKKLFAEIGVDNLPRHQDPKSALARDMMVFGLPTTILIDPEGNEIARLRGDATWNSDSAKAIIQALIASE